MKPDWETVIPVWEHMKKSLIPERNTLEEDPENCTLEKVAKIVEFHTTRGDQKVRGK